MVKEIDADSYHVRMRFFSALKPVPTLPKNNTQSKHPQSTRLSSEVIFHYPSANHNGRQISSRLIYNYLLSIKISYFAFDACYQRWLVKITTKKSCYHLIIDSRHGIWSIIVTKELGMRFSAMTWRPNWSCLINCLCKFEFVI